ncbi:MAG TPA: hypothetical protein P5234_09475 [Thermoanaerobaculaceae bacterium]|nr:hypothetical protein [Thermoanaerobaculaceae bacterium]HRS16460.1 hypothetical protein [Thermoanaerobaculaceae bacterium]
MGRARWWLAVTAAALAGSALAAEEEGVVRIRLALHVGQQVELEARPAVAIWQHLVGSVPGKLPEYVDLEDGQQIVAHIAGGLPCRGPMVLRGVVVEARGGPKRPGLPPPKADETWVEHALDVHAVVCVPAVGELPLLVERLADQNVDPDAKRADENRLVAAGLAAVPLLLAHLGDARQTWSECEGSPLAGTAGATPPMMSVQKLFSVGDRCRRMLARIVAPRNYRSPLACGSKAPPAGEDGAFFSVADWPAFFAARSGRSLAAIRAEMEPVLDRYHASGGVVQPVR